MITIDVSNGRKQRAVFQGRVVTIIEAAGRQVRVAETGQWHPRKLCFPLSEEQIKQDHIDAIKEHVAGKSIASIKPKGAGVQLIFEDNTRLNVKYIIDGEGIAFSVLDSDGNKVVLL